MLELKQINKVMFDLYAQGYPAADIRYAIDKYMLKDYDSVARFEKDIKDLCSIRYDDTYYDKSTLV